MNPITPFRHQFGIFLLDGALATELETRGYNLQDPLWSAKLLLEKPEAIRQLHYDYLQAGADCLITASYQATLPGFAKRGIAKAQAIALLHLSVQLAREARDQFWTDPHNQIGRLRPLVAASVGPYGAYLADGSEYRGNYRVGRTCLYNFHRPRWQILAHSGADLLACETIPAFDEAQALHQLIQETPEQWVWVSFSCQNGRQISDGTPIADCARLFQECPNVAAIGVNCTAPRWIPSLITELRQATDKPILVYPNSGEGYDAGTKTWYGENSADSFAHQSHRWQEAGATIIGGCCRTSPNHIRHLRQTLLQEVNLFKLNKSLESP